MASNSPQPKTLTCSHRRRPSRVLIGEQAMARIPLMLAVLSRLDRSNPTDSLPAADR
jgi:hypothetical protein